MTQMHAGGGDDPLPTIPKAWWRSRRMVGLLVAAVAMPLGLFGVSFDVGQATEIILVAVQLVGLVIAFIGSLNAEHPIDPGAVAPGVRVPGVEPKSRMRADGVPSPSAKNAEDRDDTGPFGF